MQTVQVLDGREELLSAPTLTSTFFFYIYKKLLKLFEGKEKNKTKRTPHNSLFDIFSIWMSSWRDVSLKCDKLEKQNED